ncbi:hypothetical protein FSP39_003084 [Pinctada imbricata]|uniref:Shieldin complex subunit 2 first OB fold domain-containing protein n=1 Tax=Pinctada imbricata TaxID=66713 RepID=A0AA88YUL9_PINIB|nr:hypothetical protein FSP39_003084 [Pinctada imbricata]
MNVAFADCSEVVKGVCFDKQKFQQFTEGSGVVLRNIIIKQDELIITKQSSVFKCKDIEVSEELQTKAKQIIYPPLPSLMTITEAKKSPTRERLRIRAKVISEDLRTTRMIRTGEVPLRTITIADQDDTVKVALWRDMADADVRPGDHIEITNVVINNYQNQVHLQTTQLSSIEVIMN